MAYRVYRGEEGKDVVLERPDGSLVKLPCTDDEGSYKVPADVVQELAAQRCDQTEQVEETEKPEAE